MPEPTTNCLLSSIVTFLGGGFVGAFISHFLTRSREAETAKTNRKLQFRRFLATWKAELGTEHPDNFTTRYPGKVALLRAEVAAVRNDFEGPRLKKFDKLVLDLCSLTTEQISHHPNKASRDVIGEPLDALIEFVERN